ncbi:MAG: hypothetical protein SAK29_24460 [Scytonema sp. PMC 1069.18]|nr:hypothetical protein [Scytonema sp. PMC 1069.18]MEC4887722.1 hypothetical protein [Scytonema sp. PMC 1070.18]
MLHINTFFFNHQPIKLYLLGTPEKEVTHEFKEKCFVFKATELLIAFGIVDNNYFEYRYFEENTDSFVPISSTIKHYFRKEKLIGVDELGSRTIVEWRGIASLIGVLPNPLENFNIVWEVEAFIHRYSQVLSQVYKEKSSKFTRRNADGSEHIQYFCYESCAELHRAVQIEMLSNNVVHEQSCFADVALYHALNEESICLDYLSEEQLAIKYGRLIGRKLSKSSMRDLLVQCGLLMKSLNTSLRTKYEPTRIGDKYMLHNPRRWHKSVITLLLTDERLA